MINNPDNNPKMDPQYMPQNYATNVPPQPYGYPPAQTPTNAPLALLSITTALEIHGSKVVQELGIVYGIVARSLGVGKSITAGLRTIGGGEIKQYTQLVEDSRRHALDRMIDNARIVGANAIIAVKFDSSEIIQGVTEVIAYGTAVVVIPQNHLQN